MPRRKREPNADFPYHAVARTNNCVPFALPLEQVWTIMEDYLYCIHGLFRVEICAFVLMNNHFHLLVRSPEANLSAAMNYFMRETSKRIGTETDTENHAYGTPHHPSLIRGTQHYSNAYKYVYRNPVRAGACRKVEEYPFSTLAGLLGQRPLFIPVAEDLTLFSATEACLNWLNTEPAADNTEATRQALTKANFGYAKKRGSRKPHPLETSLY